MNRTIEVPVEVMEWCHFHDDHPDLCQYLIGFPDACDLRPRLKLAEDYADQLVDQFQGSLISFAAVRVMVDDFIRRNQHREPRPTSWIPESLGAAEIVERMLLRSDGKWLEPTDP